MTATPSTRYARSRAVEASTAGDRAILYHRQSRTALVLNPTGAWVWDLLAHPRTTEDLAQRLCERFPAVNSPQAVDDVARLLQDLLQHGMIAAEP